MALSKFLLVAQSVTTWQININKCAVVHRAVPLGLLLGKAAGPEYVHANL